MISKKLKQLRESKNLSQGQLAKLTGINQMMISKYERDESNPTIETLGKIAKALDVSTDYLIFDNVPQNGRTELNDIELFEKFRLIEQMREEDRKIIKSIIDALIVKRQVEGVVKTHLQVSVNQ